MEVDSYSWINAFRYDLLPFHVKNNTPKFLIYCVKLSSAP